MTNTALKAQRAIAAVYKKPYELITVAEMLMLSDELVKWANAQCEHSFFKCQVPAPDSCVAIYHQVCRLCRWDETRGVYMPPDIWQGWALRQLARALGEDPSISMQDTNKTLTRSEMNELMATEVMGWHTHAGSWCDAEGHWIAYWDDCFREPAWSPYDYIADAWQLVEHILLYNKRLLQFRAEIVTGGGKYQYAKFVDCGDNSAPVYGACAPSMPLAICRAALRVLKEANDE